MALKKRILIILEIFIFVNIMRMYNKLSSNV